MTIVKTFINASALVSAVLAGAGLTLLGVLLGTLWAVDLL